MQIKTLVLTSFAALAIAHREENESNKGKSCFSASDCLAGHVCVGTNGEENCKVTCADGRKRDIEKGAGRYTGKDCSSGQACLGADAEASKKATCVTRRHGQ